jgi:hypothetical protein
MGGDSRAGFDKTQGFLQKAGGRRRRIGEKFGGRPGSGDGSFGKKGQDIRGVPGEADFVRHQNERTFRLA